MRKITEMACYVEYEATPEPNMTLPRDWQMDGNRPKATACDAQPSGSDSHATTTGVTFRQPL